MYVQLDVWDEPLGWIRGVNEVFFNKWKNANWIWNDDWNRVEIDAVIYEKLESTIVGDATVLDFLKQHCLLVQLNKTVIIVPMKVSDS